MIKGSFKRNETGMIVSFELSGHASAAEYGEDIICAAVSALTINTVNGIEALAGFQPIVDIDEVEEGYMYVETVFDVNQEQTNISQILLENLLLGLQGIQEEYSDFVQIITEN
ncbi:ribosomal-processing cysteine protease Prp [Enterococcus sp. BWB1-3]|uniref:ribosomal-processing cysteine protease Prp n=1 Tax=unclassified Enterococcus TaxID=2608891 RepID=UPI001920B89A|nr:MULTISPECIES: ribosomal-processing cysteine protease Prp [unclassified Enterococcus]MBL1227822.1 ribosomal-processing cysteine protease Prp [Enterococcus sp. BWB1-3]MCB5953313.1 ribosomal-processing cysteine protease Prp [Enterococcus sp. BWT-B8]